MKTTFLILYLVLDLKSIFLILKRFSNMARNLSFKMIYVATKFTSSSLSTKMPDKNKIYHVVTFLCKKSKSVYSTTGD